MPARRSNLTISSQFLVSRSLLSHNSVLMNTLRLILERTDLMAQYDLKFSHDSLLFLPLLLTKKCPSLSQKLNGYIFDPGHNSTRLHENLSFPFFHASEGIVNRILFERCWTTL